MSGHGAPTSGNEDWTETVLGAPGSGDTVSAPLTIDKSGNLYGTAYETTYGGLAQLCRHHFN
jgi:hypothetical protein